MQEFRSDTPVEPDPAGDVLHVGAHFLAEIGDFVDEGDLGREEGVGRVLDHLRGLQRGQNDRGLQQVKRPVDGLQNPGGTLALDPDHDPIGAHEVADRRTFAKELGVGGDVERLRRAMLRNEPFDLAAGADRDGRLHDDDLVAVVHAPGDLLGGLANAAKIGLAVAVTAGGSDGDEYGLRARHGFFGLGGEGKPAGADIRSDQGFQAGLVDRNLAAPQHVDLRRVLVDADHVDAELRKAGAGHKTDITRTDHSDAHRSNPCSWIAGRAIRRQGPRFVPRVTGPRNRPAAPAAQLPSRISFAWLILAAR